MSGYVNKLISAIDYILGLYVGFALLPLIYFSISAVFGDGSWFIVSCGWVVFVVGANRLGKQPPPEISEAERQKLEDSYWSKLIRVVEENEKYLVVDDTYLPCMKEIAVIVAKSKMARIKSETDFWNPLMYDPMQIYLGLAKFQPDVGGREKWILEKMPNAKDIMNKSNSFNQWLKWQEVVLREQEELAMALEETIKCDVAAQ